MNIILNAKLYYVWISLYILMKLFYIIMEII